MLAKDGTLRQVWPDTFVEEVNLAVNISTIRKALGENPKIIGVSRLSRFVAKW